MEAFLKLDHLLQCWPFKPLPRKNHQINYFLWKINISFPYGQEKYPEMRMQSELRTQSVQETQRWLPRLLDLYKERKFWFLLFLNLLSAFGSRGSAHTCLWPLRLQESRLDSTYTPNRGYILTGKSSGSPESGLSHSGSIPAPYQGEPWACTDLPHYPSSPLHPLSLGTPERMLSCSELWLLSLGVGGDQDPTIKKKNPASSVANLGTLNCHLELAAFLTSWIVRFELPFNCPKLAGVHPFLSRSGPDSLCNLSVSAN